MTTSTQATAKKRNDILIGTRCMFTSCPATLLDFLEEVGAETSAVVRLLDSIPAQQDIRFSVRRNMHNMYVSAHARKQPEKGYSSTYSLGGVYVKHDKSVPLRSINWKRDIAYLFGI